MGGYMLGGFEDLTVVLAAEVEYRRGGWKGKGNG